MNRDELIRAIQKEGQFSFSRSGGPGGQNVNKVNTKVLLVLSPESLDCLNEEEILKVKKKLSGRMNSQGELYLQLQEERSQLLNREKAVEKMADLISDALIVQRKRKKTRPGRAAVQRRLEGKKRQGQKKKSRGTVSFHD